MCEHEHRAAFTLIELLVVITIIVVLLSLLTPALDKAIDQAERVVCAANLDAFHHGVAAYFFDHRRRVLNTARHYLHLRPYPNVPYVYQDTNWGDWNLEAMKPYVGGIGETEVKGPWICPSNQVEYQQKEQAYRDSLNYPRGVNWLNDDGVWIHSDYSYYAGVGEWREFATKPDDLTMRTLQSGRLLMADSVYRHNSPFYWYNHGEFVRPGPPVITGINRMFGDGSVQWEDTWGQRRSQAIHDGNTPDMGEWVSAWTIAERPAARANDSSFYGGPLPD